MEHWYGMWKMEKLENLLHMYIKQPTLNSKIQKHTRSQIPYDGMKDNNFDTMHIAYKHENRNCYYCIIYASVSCIQNKSISLLSQSQKMQQTNCIEKYIYIRLYIPCDCVIFIFGEAPHPQKYNR